MDLILLGYPGAGKGTQAEMLKAIGFKHISTGDIIRDEIKRGTLLGKQVESNIAKGNLVPDSLIIDILINAISGKTNILFDGFPRTLAQGEALLKYFEKRGKEEPKVILLKISEEEVLKRLTSRRICSKCGNIENIHDAGYKGVCSKCGGTLYTRADDELSSAKHRLEVFKKETEPLLEFYSKQAGYLTIDGKRSAEEVFTSIRQAIEV